MTEQCEISQTEINNRDGLKASGHKSLQLTITAALPSTNKVEMICCKVTGLNILITANDQKEKAGKKPSKGIKEL